MATQQHLDRLSAVDAGFLAPGEAQHAHAHRRARAVRGRAAGARRVPRPHRARGCTSCRATGRSWRCRRWRPGGRCGSTTRTSTSPTTCGTPRCRSPATRTRCWRWPRGCSRSGWTARSRCGSCGSSRALPAAGFALLSKTHHALVDGVSGVDLATRAVRPRARARGAVDGAEPWVPQPEPSSAELAAARADRRGAGGRRGRAPARSARSPSPARRSTRRARSPRASARCAWTGAQPAARHAAQRRARPAPADRRSCAPGSTSFKLVKNAFGGTVNDVVLAVVPARCAYFLQSRGRRTEGLELQRRRAGLRALRRPARRARQPADAARRAAAGRPRRPARAAAATSRRRWTG